MSILLPLIDKISDVQLSGKMPVSIVVSPAFRDALFQAFEDNAPLRARDGKLWKLVNPRFDQQVLGLPVECRDDASQPFEIKCIKLKPVREGYEIRQDWSV